VVQIHSPRPLFIRTNSNLHGKKMAKNAWIPTRSSQPLFERFIPIYPNASIYLPKSSIVCRPPSKTW
jgi:hypothetical protein